MSTDELSPEMQGALPTLPPCKVCGERGAGFHYGANTCEACKGFFHRSLRVHTTYKCTGQGCCDVRKVKKKRTCQLCRYNRCLAVGMGREAIKTGRYTSRKKAEDIKEVKRHFIDSSETISCGFTATLASADSDAATPTPAAATCHQDEAKMMPSLESSMETILHPPLALDHDRAPTLRSNLETLTTSTDGNFSNQRLDHIQTSRLGPIPETLPRNGDASLRHPPAPSRVCCSAFLPMSPLSITTSPASITSASSPLTPGSSYLHTISPEDTVGGLGTSSYHQSPSYFPPGFDHDNSQDGREGHPHYCEPMTGWLNPGDYNQSYEADEMYTYHSTTQSPSRSTGYAISDGSSQRPLRETVTPLSATYSHFSREPEGSTTDPAHQEPFLFSGKPSTDNLPDSVHQPDPPQPLDQALNLATKKKPVVHEVTTEPCKTVTGTRKLLKKRMSDCFTRLCYEVVKTNAEPEHPESSESMPSLPQQGAEAHPEDIGKIDQIGCMYLNKEEAIQSVMRARDIYMAYIKAHTNIIMDPGERRKALEQHVENCQERTNLFGPQKYLPDEIYDDIWRKTGIDADGRKALLSIWQTGTEIMVNALVRFAKNLPGFKLLETDIQAELIKSARFEFNMLMATQFFDSELKAGYIPGSEFIYCPRELGQIFNTGFHSYYSDFTARIGRLQLTDPERAIMEALVVFATDRPDMGRPSSQAAAIHWELVQCLRCLLARRCSHPDRMLARVISCLTEMRTVNDLAMEVVLFGMKALKYSSLLEKPLMRELLSNLVAVCEEHAQEFQFLVVPFFKQGTSRAQEDNACIDSTDKEGKPSF